MIAHFLHQQHTAVVVFDTAVENHFYQCESIAGVKKRLADDHKPLVVQVEFFLFFLILLERQARIDFYAEFSLVGNIDRIEFLLPVFRIGVGKNLLFDCLPFVKRQFQLVDRFKYFFVIVRLLAIKKQQLVAPFVNRFFVLVVIRYDYFQNVAFYRRLANSELAGEVAEQYFKEWEFHFGQFLPKIKNRYFRMMILLRKLLFPFAILYGLVTGIRNFLYEAGIFKSATFNLPVIAVGNLSVGGTGKSPQIEYLVRLLSDRYHVAILSRGYKRKSEGFVLADAQSTAETLGDEPFQFYRKFPNTMVAVDADRRNGIAKLLSQTRKPEVILLDDAFQHRKVKAGLYILLTAYGDLYSDDFMLPTGNLRETRNGANRAQIVIVTKCPKNLSDSKQRSIAEKLGLRQGQELYFTFIDYDDKVYSHSEMLEVSALRGTSKILLAGIAKPEPFFDYLKGSEDTILEFPDHHHFSDSDIKNIRQASNGRKIITTEKDFGRLNNSGLEQLYYLPIKSTFISDGGKFAQTILDFVKSAR